MDFAADQKPNKWVNKSGRRRTQVMAGTSAVMELVPEFFTLPAEWLLNRLGVAPKEGPLLDAELHSNTQFFKTLAKLFAKK